MTPTWDELLQRGKERGFLTYAELKAVLPADGEGEQLDHVLRELTDRGIELMDDADVQRDPALSERMALPEGARRRPATRRWKRPSASSAYH